MLPFELLHRDVDSLEVSNLDKEFIKCRLRDLALSSYKDNSKTLQKNLPKEKFDALKIYLKNKDTIVQKAGKANTVAKILVPMLESLTTNEYPIKESFTFVEHLFNPLTTTGHW